MSAAHAIAAEASLGPRLLLAGSPQLHRPGLEPLPLTAPDAWLLAWLALEGPTPRDRLGRLLWPDSPDESARNALRQRLFRLRRLARIDLVEGSAVLALAAGIGHDLHESHALLAAVDEPTGEELALWARQQRERRCETRVAALGRTMAEHEAAGDWVRALELARQRIEIAPLREEAHLALIRLQYLCGDRAAALRACEACEQMLDREFGAPPGAALQALRAVVQAASRPVTRVRTVPPALARPPRLAGRQAALLQLEQAMASAARVWIEAPAGLGKTRLLQAAVDLRSDALHVTARPGDAAVPYATLNRWFDALAERAPPPGSLRPTLAALWPADAGTRPAGASCATPVAHHLSQVVTAARAWLAQASPIVAAHLLDDLHLADPATLELLPELIDGPDATGAGIAWLLASRPVTDGHPAAALLNVLNRTLPPRRVVLPPLDDAALEELLESIGLDGLRGPAVATQLRVRSGGNPLFAIETLKHAWLQDGAGAASPLAWPPAEHPLQALQALLEQQLAVLSAPALQLARVAAVAGADFGVPLAAQVLQQPAVALTDAWAELESRQVIVGAAFAHDGLREAVRNGIPSLLVQHVHAEVALWLQAHGGEPARIAQHLQAAGQALAALPWLREAAARAQAAWREAERVAFLLTAADICEAHQRLDEAFELVSLAVQSHMNTTREAAGLPLLERLDRLARQPRQIAEAAGHRSWYGTALGDWDAAITHGQRALALLGDRPGPDDPLHAALSQRLGTALAMAGRFDEALPALQAARPWCEAHAGTNAAAEYLGNLAAVLDNLGRPTQALPCHEQVIETTRALGDSAFEATARANLAVSRLNAGDVAGARAQVEQARRLVAGYDRPGASAGFIAALQAQVDRAEGRYDDALACCDEARERLEQSNPGWLPVVHMHQAQIWLDLHQLARARQSLDAVDAGALAPRLRARHAWLHARWRQALGQPSAADYAEALQWAPNQGWPELRWLLRIECAHLTGSAAALDELDAVAAQASQGGHHGVAHCAQFRWLDLATQLCEPSDSLARRARERLLERAADTPPAEPWGLYHAEVWLAPARAHARLGEAQAARALAAQGWAWVSRVGQAHVAAPWRDTFWHTHPVNAALRHLARVDSSDTAG